MKPRLRDMPRDVALLLGVAALILVAAGVVRGGSITFEGVLLVGVALRWRPVYALLWLVLAFWTVLAIVGTVDLAARGFSIAGEDRISYATLLLLAAAFVCINSKPVTAWVALRRRPADEPADRQAATAVAR